MKHIFRTILIAITVIVSACGEDRSGEFYALIEDKMWIEETMKEHYLWYDKLPVIENEYDYFKEAETFFKNLLYKQAMNGKGDRYSYMENHNKTLEGRATSLSRESTYGIEFELVNDPLGTTTRTYAHVLYTLPHSPAEVAGIKRGDWITSIHGEKITSDNYKQLQSGSDLRLSIDKIVHTEEGPMWQAVDTLTLAASVKMEIIPFLIDSIYETNGKKIAYLMYNEFATGPENNGSETTYNEQMKQIFAKFKAKNPDALILDLRYNTGGYLQCAQALGSLIAPETALGKDFINLNFNDQTSPQVQHFPFESEYAEANLNLSNIYILTSAYTASASEALIYGLIPYMGKENIVLLGERTEGKNVAMTAYHNESYGYTLWPVVAYVSNADNQGDYQGGITPHYKLNENDIMQPWYALGDTREYLLKNTLNLITTGTISDNKEYSPKFKATYSSIEERVFPAIIIQ